MRRDLLILFSMVWLGQGFQIQPMKISVRKSEHAMESTTEDPDAYNSYDPFDLDDASFFSDLSNNSKRIKLQLETAQFIQKFGAQELLNIILRKVQSVNLPSDSKGAINDFLDFVEDLIYSNAASKIEKRLKMEELSNAPKRKLHVGEVKMENRERVKPKLEFAESKDLRRRDAPALTQLSQNAVLIDEDENYPAVRQPLEPTKLAFFTHNEPNLFGGEESIVKDTQKMLKVPNRDIRRSPSKLKRRRMSKAQLEKVVTEYFSLYKPNSQAIKSAEREAQVVEMEKILKRRREKRKEMKRQREREQAMKRRLGMKKLPITKLDDMEMRRSPVPGAAAGQVSFNEKMFQLLDEYGIKSFRVETADYTVRAFANPEKTRFSSIKLLDVPEYNEAIRRKPSRPPFVYSRTIQAPNRSMLLIPREPESLRRKTAKKLRRAQKKRRSLYLERLL